MGLPIITLMGCRCVSQGRRETGSSPESDDIRRSENWVNTRKWWQWIYPSRRKKASTLNIKNVFAPSLQHPQNKSTYISKKIHKFMSFLSKTLTLWGPLLAVRSSIQNMRHLYFPHRHTRQLKRKSWKPLFNFHTRDETTEYGALISTKKDERKSIFLRTERSTSTETYKFIFSQGWETQRLHLTEETWEWLTVLQHLVSG